MNIYKKAMLLRYYKYDLKNARKKITAQRIIFFTLANISNYLYTKTKDVSFLFLFNYFLIEQLNSFRNLEIYSNEYYDLKNMYEEVVNNYNNNINKAFGFNNPVDIAHAYNFAYKTGFLSKDFIFNYSSKNKELVENPTIFGASIFTGKGCCRHSSKLLSDILNDYGFDSITISTGFNSCYRTVKVDKIPMDSLDLLMSLATPILEEKDISKEDLLNSVSILSSNGISISEIWEHDRNHVPRNHAITGVIYNGLAYYIDSTNEEFYRMDEDTGRLVNQTNDVENTIKKRLYDTLNNKRKEKKLLSLPSYDLNDINSSFIKTNLLCLDNYDVFEKFYNDNHEAYEEITEKLKKINM